MKPEALFAQVRQYTSLARRFNRSYRDEVDQLAKLLCEYGEEPGSDKPISNEACQKWLEQFENEYRTWDGAYRLPGELGE
jgi:hypothetical protein